MRFWRCFALVSLALGPLAAAEPPLPTWSERLRTEKPLASSRTAPAGQEDGIPAEGEPEEDADLLADFAVDPPMGPVAEDSGFPEPYREAAEGDVQAAGAAAPLSERHLEGYFSAQAGQGIVDPQGWLDAEQSARIEAVLENHASDSRIALQLWLLGEGQDIPGDVRLEELHERRPAEEGPMVVVIAEWGKPEAVRWFPSWDLVGGLSAAELRRMLQAAVPFAMRESDPAAQLAELLHHLSLRLYWVESRLAGAADPQGEAGENPAGEAEAAAAGATVGIPPWFARLAEGPLAGVSRQDLNLAGAALAVMLAGTVFLRLRALRRQWLFPEIEVENRLGGPHAAGVGAVISYASPNLPPAVQRESLPDYLSRA